MNFFVKLSQNKKVVVPMVIVVGLVIFSGGYFINDSRKVAKQSKEDNQTQTETKQDNLTQVEPAEKTEEKAKPAETEDYEKSVSDDANDDSKTPLEPQYVDVEVEYEGSTVTVTVYTKKDGKCSIQYKSGNSAVTPAPVSLTDGRCQFSGIDADGKVVAKFISTDGTTTGNSSDD